MTSIFGNALLVRLLAVGLVTVLVGCTASKRDRPLATEVDERLFVSCQNHRAHLNGGLRLEIMLEEGSNWPPYVPDTQGYAMLAIYAGRLHRELCNCNHGAPRPSRIGGWQAVNLSQEQWWELHRIWAAHGHHGMLPFYWCGKPNPLQKRVFCTLWHSGDGWFIDHEVIPEVAIRERIGKLNKCLSELGLAHVSVDVPDGVQWDSFEAEGKR